MLRQMTHTSHLVCFEVGDYCFDSDWKEIVDEWVKATAIVGSEGIPDSVNPSVVYEEEGLPSPPMDEGAFLVASTGSIELSQFFDGMIDIGNPPQNGQNEPTVKPSRPVAADSGPGRPPKSSMQPKSNVEPKAGEEVENGTVTMKPPVDQQAKSKYLEEVAARIEAAKKNLREKRDGGAEKRNARGSNFDVL
ncbi:putative mediator of RNA polymerase II transcription subunit 26b [Arachis hypogaea]|nr:putative mediator of RNA polymerase II transcription subunit 26b [Arachis hypogaea]